MLNQKISSTQRHLPPLLLTYQITKKKNGLILMRLSMTMSYQEVLRNSPLIQKSRLRLDCGDLLCLEILLMILKESAKMNLGSMLKNSYLMKAFIPTQTKEKSN